MRAGGVDALVASLLGEQRDLEELLRHQNGPADTLAIGRALLRFATREDAAFAALTPLLDPAAHLALTAEHRQIAEDLELLEWLIATTPESCDVPLFAASLGRRMQQHIQRDGRLLSRARGFVQE